ncbi:zinc finger protein 561 [Glossina fuscipes]|uniref:Zinc finger protein 561 n=1 Tax=Glossina fuscipes TaxID=7396 RepID=A0A9C5Z703_9MUSC|nr:zinc finger protein 561 [Glossina fuscipes]
MSVVIDLKAVCLICLQPEKSLHDIFAPDEKNPELQVSFKIGRCSNMKLDPNNKRLPNKICESCLEDLQIAWRFRQNCETALTIFRTILRDQDDTEILSSKQFTTEKIKVPEGLKIKCVETESKNFCTATTSLEAEINEDDPTKSNELEREKKFAFHTETIKLESEDDDHISSADTGPYQTEEYVEYYMSEEIIDEEAGADTIVEIQEENFKTNAAHSFKAESPSAGSSSSKFNKYLEDNSDVLVTDIPEIEKQPTPARRTRGRPRKYYVNANESNLNPSHPGDDDSANQSEDNIKPPAMTTRHVRTRKRKVSPPDSQPAKICEICGNKYRYQHALNAHMRRHNNDKPFPCEFCDKAFISHVELRRHIRVHTGHKPYACQYCDRRFSDFGSRIKHERTHTGERPYSCNTCGKSFAYAHVLSVHYRTHTGEKKFRCDQCDKGFTKKAYLLSHMQHHARANEVDNAEMMNMKSVALEECILTTEYIEEGEEMDEEEDGTEIHVLMGEHNDENEFTVNVR